MRPRIATKLAFLLIPLVLLPFASLGYFWYSATRTELETQVRGELQARLRQFGFRLRPFLRERELDLHDIATSPAVADYYTQVDYRLLEEAGVARAKLADFLGQFVRIRQPFVADVRYLDEHGIEVAAATAEGPLRERKNRSGMPMYRRAREGPPGKVVSLIVERSETLGKPLFRIALAVYDRWQEFRGLIVLGMPMDHIYAMLADALVGRQGTPFLLDEEGNILGPPGARETLRAQWAGAGEPDATLRTLPQLGETIQVTRLKAGGGGLLVLAPVGAQGWSAGTFAPLTETETRVAALTRFTLTYGAIAALVLVGVAGLVARGASRRVRRLQAAVAQVEQGHFALRLPAETRDELGDLARSFNTMAESLARRDAEVQARTAEVERRRQELEVLNTVIRAAHTSLNLRESLEAILDSLMALFKFPSGALRLLDESTGALEMAAHRGLRPDYAANPVPLWAGKGHMGRALEAGRPLVCNDPADIADLKDRVAEGMEVRGALFIPILAQGKPLGVIALVADWPLVLTDAELNLLANIGLEVGSATSNARLFSQTQALLGEAERHRARAEALAEIGRAVTATLEPDRVLDLLVERTCKAMGADAGGILRFADGALRYVRSWGLSPEHAQRIALQPGEGVAGAATLSRAPVWTADVLADPRFEPFVRTDQLRLEGIRAILCAPIILGNDVYGVFSILHRQPHPFGPEEVGFAAAVAQQAAIAITNARLYAEAASKGQRLEALNYLAAGVTSTLELQHVLNAIVRAATELFGDASSNLWLLEEGEETLSLRADTSRRPELRAATRLPVGEGLVGWIVRERRPLVIDEIAGDSRMRNVAWARAEGFRALAGVPLLMGDRCLGALCVNRRSPTPFAPEELNLMASLGAHAAIAIQNARLYADLQAAYQQLKTAQDQALQVEKLRALGEMAAGVAHDFNNLLAAILGRAQLLKVRIMEPQLRGGLEVIERAALDGAETVRRILGFARARGHEQMEAVEVETVLRQVVEVTSPRWKDEAQARGVAIEVQLALEPVPPVQGNPAELREVFVNLVFNAVDAMPAGGTITLGARPLPGDAAGDGGGGQSVEMFVRDTGTGMPEAVRRRALDPFFTTKGQRGSGLGLSVAFGIVSRHGGTIRIDSREGEGTTVSASLPAAAPARGPARKAAGAATPPARILVVDDEQMLADVLAEILRLEGHTVDAVTDPRLALDRLQTNSVDLLFTDLGMPEISGWDVAAQARALHPDLRVILVTGWGHQIDPERLQASGVAGVVSKPFRMEDVSQAVAAALKSRPTSA